MPDLTDFDVSPYRYPIDMDFSAIDTIEVKVYEFDGEKYVLEFDVTP